MGFISGIIQCSSFEGQLHQQANESSVVHRSEVFPRRFLTAVEYLLCGNDWNWNSAT